MRAASQVASRGFRGVGMWGRARAVLVGTRCGASAPPPVAPAALCGLGTVSSRTAWSAAPPPGFPGSRSPGCARCLGLQLCTVAAWAWGWETAGAPRGSAGWGGKEPSDEDYEAINSRSCYWFRIRSSSSTGTNLCPWEQELRREIRLLVCDAGEVWTSLSPFC